MNNDEKYIMRLSQMAVLLEEVIAVIGDINNELLDYDDPLLEDLGNRLEVAVERFSYEQEEEY